MLMFVSMAELGYFGLPLKNSSHKSTIILTQILYDNLQEHLSEMLIFPTAGLVCTVSVPLDCPYKRLKDLIIS